MEQYNGFWVPNGAYGKLFFRDVGVDGLSAHCLEHIDACLNVLGPRRRSVAIDGGAYVGIWSMYLVRHFTTVLAFDPIQTNVDCYHKNVRPRLPKGHNVTIEPRALSSGIQEDFIWNIGKPYGIRFPLPDDMPNQEDLLPIQTITIDSLDLPSLDLLKLDVEGHEYEALQGSLDSIQKFKPVVIIEEKLDPEKRATQLLEKLGMRCTWRKKHDYLFTW